MPHLTVEYSSNLPQIKSSDILLRLNKTMLESGLFGSDLEIKSRLLEFDSFLIGTQTTGQAFVHVKVVC